MSAGTSDDDFELVEAATPVRTDNKPSTVKRKQSANSRKKSGGSRKKPREESYESFPPVSTATTNRSRRAVATRLYREPVQESGNSSDRDFVAKPVRKRSLAARKSSRSSTKSRNNPSALKRPPLLSSDDNEPHLDDLNVSRATTAPLSSTVDLAVEHSKVEKCFQLLSRAERSRRELTEQMSQKLHEGVSSFLLGNVDMSQLDMYDVEFAIDIAVAEAPDSLPTSAAEGFTSVSFSEFDISPARRFVSGHTVTIARQIINDVEPESASSRISMERGRSAPTELESWQPPCDLILEAETSPTGWYAPYPAGELNVESGQASMESRDELHGTKCRDGSGSFHTDGQQRRNSRTPLSFRRRGWQSQSHYTPSQASRPLQSFLDDQQLSHEGGAPPYNDRDASSNKGAGSLHYDSRSPNGGQMGERRESLERYHSGKRFRNRSKK